MAHALPDNFFNDVDSSAPASMQAASEQASPRALPDDFFKNQNKGVFDQIITGIAKVPSDIIGLPGQIYQQGKEIYNQGYGAIPSAELGAIHYNALANELNKVLPYNKEGKPRLPLVPESNAAYNAASNLTGFGGTQLAANALIPGSGLLWKALQLGAGGAAYSAATAPEGQRIQAAVEGGLANPAIAGIGKAVPIIANIPATGYKTASRLADVIKATPEEAAEDSPYNAIKKEANEKGIKIRPDTYAQALQDRIDSIESGTSEGPDSKLLKALKNRQVTLTKEFDDPAKPDAYSVNGIHQQLRGLNEEIGNALKAGDNNTARIYGELKNSMYQDLVKKLSEQGNANLAIKFLAAQENYAKNVIPLKKFPTSGPAVLKQAGLLAAMTHLPVPLEEFAAITAGLHNQGGRFDPITNAYHRYASTYAGGPPSPVPAWAQHVPISQISPYVLQALQKREQNE